MAKETKKQGIDSPGNNPKGVRQFRQSSIVVADWAAADAKILLDVVRQACYAEGAVRFGVSRDGGAFALGIYGDGEPYTVWIPCTADINEVLKDLATTFETIQDQNAVKKLNTNRQ